MKYAIVSGSTDDSVFHCTVQRDIDLSTNQIFGLRNEWYFMFALGNVNKGNRYIHDENNESVCR
jgi:hypothetical protein